MSKTSSSTGLKEPSRDLALDAVRGQDLLERLGQRTRFSGSNLDGSQIEDLVATGLNDALRPRPRRCPGARSTGPTGAADKIQRSNLDGSGSRRPGRYRAATSPRGIALDTGRGQACTGPTGARTSIQRANLDGSDVEDLVTDRPAAPPRSLALDLSRGQACTGPTSGTDKHPAGESRRQRRGRPVHLISVPCHFTPFRKVSVKSSIAVSYVSLLVSCRFKQSLDMAVNL